ALAAGIEGPMVGEAARWGDQMGSGPFTRNDHWAGSRDGLLRDYFPRRSAIVLDQFRSAGLYPVTAAPTIIPAGGVLPPGETVTLSAPAGTIYYTTDGSDPRQPGGTVNPGARHYTAPIRIDRTSRVVARTFQNNRWSGPTASTFVTDSPALALTEIMYHPTPPPVGDTNAVSNFEFIELRNLLPVALDLSGYRLVDGVGFDFSVGTVGALPPGGRVVVVANRTAFETRYGSLPAVTGEFTGSLDNGGETLRLLGPMGQLVQEVRYKDGWYPATDGNGFALVSTHPNAAVTTATESSDLRAGSVLNGTPGTVEPPAPTLPRVLINEVLTHTDLPQVDSIELYNPEPTAADISGWYLSDDPRAPKYRLPAGSVVPAHGFLVMDEARFNPGLGGANEFNLRSSGDEVFLFSAREDGSLTGYVHGYRFGAALNGVSFGRYIIGTGEEHFVSQARTTLGEANAGPRVGPVVISEIMYHPFSPLGGGDDASLEYIELYNLTDQPVDLFNHLGGRTNSWGLSGAVECDFGEATLPPRGYLLVVPEFADAAASQQFLATYGLDSTASPRLLGPFKGRLANEGEPVRLQAPLEPVAGNDGHVHLPMMLVDQVGYGPDPPWPSAANGSGLSLQRYPVDGYGNEPLNWVAAAPTPLGPMGANAGDRDNDGLPDEWEWRYGLDLWSAEGANGAAGDPDDDGLSNAEELRLGTDPTQITVRFSRLWITGRQLYLAFHATAGRPYRVEYRDDLRTGEWKLLTNVDPRTASGEVDFWTLMPTGGTERFYRLMTF
ncbi:MAG: lamin tail domain-containing protein, partial [Verrucomicrobiae bacterium]|nr:lamin tail domain-containing protein [Verrucomicrobiae bacterium]